AVRLEHDAAVVPSEIGEELAACRHNDPLLLRPLEAQILAPGKHHGLECRLAATAGGGERDPHTSYPAEWRTGEPRGELVGADRVAVTDPGDRDHSTQRAAGGGQVERREQRARRADAIAGD